MHTELKANSLSFFESLVMGVAGSAPGYTIAITTAVLLATVGTLAPGALLIFSVPMLGIAVAYKQLSKRDVNAGAAYQWTTAELGRFMGFFSGWALLIASMVFMVSGSIPIATATLDFVAPSMVGNVVLTAGVASAWFLLVAVVLIAGIEITSRVQVVMTTIELAILAAMLVAAFVHTAAVGAVNPLRWSWFGLGYTPESFAASALVVVFFYWGWDVTSNLGEETVGGGDNAGNGGFASVLVTILFFLGFTMAAMFLFSLKDARHLTDNIVYNMAVASGLGKTGGLCASIAVILSSIATLETTMLQFSRTLFAMGRDGALPRSFGEVGVRTQTPVRAMFVLMAVGLALIWGSSLMPSVSTIIASSVNAVAIEVAYYYGLAGLIAGWVARTAWRRSLLTWLGICVFPALSGLSLIVLGLYAIVTFNMVTKVVALGGFAAGILFYRPQRYRARVAAAES